MQIELLVEFQTFFLWKIYNKITFCLHLKNFLYLKTIDLKFTFQGFLEKIKLNIELVTVLVNKKTNNFETIVIHRLKKDFVRTKNQNLIKE
ncbi:MAG: hypothetical protein WCG45_04440 [bacterium]